MFPFAACPGICPSHEAIKQTKSNALRDVDTDQIDVYLYSKEALSPRLPFLLAPSQAAYDVGRPEGGRPSTNRKTYARTPQSPTLGFVIGHVAST